MSEIHISYGGQMTRLLETFLAFVALVLIVVVVAWRLAIHAIHGVVLKRLSLSPGMHVVDIGCGAGRLTARIARVVSSTGHVMGIDTNARALRAAEKHSNAAGLKNISFVLAGAGEGALGQARFDRAVLVAVLGEITDRKAAMAEIFQALKPGGLLSVTEVATDPHRQRGDEIRRLAKVAGFAEQACCDGPLIFTITLVKPP